MPPSGCPLVWCDAGAAAFGYGDDEQIQDRQQLQHMLGRIDALPLHPDRSQALKNLAGSFRWAVSEKVEAGDEISFLMPVFDALMARAPLMDSEARGQSLEMLASLVAYLPQARVRPEWARLMDQIRTLPEAVMPPVLGAMAQRLGRLDVGEIDAAVDTLWRAAATLDAPIRHDAALLIAEGIDDVQNHNEDAFDEAAQALLVRGHSLGPQYGAPFLQTIRQLFGLI